MNMWIHGFVCEIGTHVGVNKLLNLCFHLRSAVSVVYWFGYCIKNAMGNAYISTRTHTGTLARMHTHRSASDVGLLYATSTVM